MYDPFKHHYAGSPDWGMRMDVGSPFCVPPNAIPYGQPSIYSVHPQTAYKIPTVERPKNRFCFFVIATLLICLLLAVILPLIFLLRIDRVTTTSTSTSTTTTTTTTPSTTTTTTTTTTTPAPTTTVLETTTDALTTETTAAVTVTACDAEIDLVLLLDSSGSIGPTNWTILTQFAAQLVGQFQNTRVGYVVFSGGAGPIVDFNSNVTAVQAMLLVEPFQGGGTNTAAALNAAATLYANSPSMAVPVTVLFTDGGSNNNAATLTAASNLRNMNVTIVSVGIGGNLNTQELMDVSSDGTFLQPDFDTLNAILLTLLNQVCDLVLAP